MNEGKALAQSETVNAQGRVLLNGIGLGYVAQLLLTGEWFYPDKWQVFSALAE